MDKVVTELLPSMSPISMDATQIEERLKLDIFWSCAQQGVELLYSGD